jgi:hypothetical protein
VQSCFAETSRANQSPVHSLQRSLVLPRRIGNEHLSPQIMGEQSGSCFTRCASSDRFTILHLN